MIAQAHRPLLGLINHPLLGLPQFCIYGASTEFLNGHVHGVEPNPEHASMSVIVTVRKCGGGHAFVDEQAQLNKIEDMMADIARTMRKDHQKLQVERPLSEVEWPIPDINGLQQAVRGGRGNSKAQASAGGQLRRIYGAAWVEVSIVSEGVEFSNPLLNGRFQLCFRQGGKQYIEGESVYLPNVASTYTLLLPAAFVDCMGLQEQIGPDPFVKPDSGELRMLKVCFAAEEIVFEKGKVIPLSTTCRAWESGGVIDTSQEKVGGLNRFVNMWPRVEESKGGKIQVKVFENWNPLELSAFIAQAEKRHEEINEKKVKEKMTEKKIRPGVKLTTKIGEAQVQLGRLKETLEHRQKEGLKIEQVGKAIARKENEIAELHNNLSKSLASTTSD
jgi:hypothetical protein